MDPMRLLIRKAIASDAPALTALMHASAAYQGHYAAILDGYAVTPAQIARDLVFLAHERDDLWGFYSLTLLPEPELDLMFVADEAQGTGLGRWLIQHLRTIATARGIAAIRIVSHPPAEGFYRRMGAERIGPQPPSGRVSWERPILKLSTSPRRST